MLALSSNFHLRLETSVMPHTQVAADSCLLKSGPCTVCCIFRECMVLKWSLKSYWGKKRVTILQNARIRSAACKLPYSKFLIPDCGSVLLAKSGFGSIDVPYEKGTPQNSCAIDFFKYSHGTMTVCKWNLDLSLQAGDHTELSLWPGEKN